MGRCETCKHFEPEQTAAGYGHCSRWHHGYGIRLEEMPPNEAWVEDDEGWGNVVGAQFGCVLHEPAATPSETSGPGEKT